MEGSNTTTNQSSSSTKASDFLEFKIGFGINLYYPPCLVLLGFIGNLMSFVIYNQFRKRSSTIFILALAVTDTLMLLLGLLQYWVLFNFLPTVLTDAHCKGMFFVVNAFGNYSHWIIVCFSIDRLIAVRFPMRSINWLTSKKAKLCLCFITAFAILKNLHYLWTTDFFYNPKTGAAICAFGLKNKAPWISIYQGFEVTVSSILPFVIISFCNIMIIKNVRITRKRLRKSRYISTKQCTSGNQQQQQQLKLASKDDGLTKTLVIVSTVFIITTCPLLVFRFYFANTDISKSTIRTQALYNLGHHICHKLWYTNNGVNFILYCWFSKSFRKNLMKLVKTIFFRVSRTAVEDKQQQSKSTFSKASQTSF